MPRHLRFIGVLIFVRFPFNSHCPLFFRSFSWATFFLFISIYIYIYIYIYI